jgi:hypothetical protein
VEDRAGCAEQITHLKIEGRMRLFSLLVALSITSILPPAVQSPANGARPPITAREAFERLRRMEGEWGGTLEMQGRTSPMTATYRLTGKGTVLVEDMGGMVTTYHLDGEQLVLTHYCTAGNQPRMKAKSLDDRHVAFEMYDITNLKPDAHHSTSLDVTFINDDKIDLLYGGMAGGKKTAPQTYHLIRNR